MLALVLAGGAGGRLGALTRERAKPVLPFGGVYRLIDFPLSNCHHSRVSDVWVLQQYEAHSVSEYLANGRPWDLDRTYGGLRVVHPYLGDDESGWYEGNADAIHRNREAIERFAPDVVLTVSADAVYQLDYGAVVSTHVEREAEVTMVTARVGGEDARRLGVVEVGRDDAVKGFTYKPDDPSGDTAAIEVFAYDTAVLLETLGELDGRDEELADFGHSLLPALVARGRAVAFVLSGYWRDVGTIASYWEAHMDLLGAAPRLLLDDRDWPVLTRAQLRPPARVTRSGSVEDSLLSPGCFVAGRVVRSVLGPGVIVERGAEIVAGVVLDDAHVSASVARVIVDADAEVEEDAGGGDEIAVVEAGG